MRTTGWQICILFHALLLPMARGSNSAPCPQQCWCTHSKLECLEFNVERTRTHLDVRCTEWSDYDFSDMNTSSVFDLGQFNQLTFANCAIPENRSLADILSFLGPLSDVSMLFFVGNSRNTHSAPLTPILFEGLDSLGTLSLKNATQHTITASDLFVHLPQLHWLDLREYRGDNYPVDLLKPLQKLRTLEVRQNLELKELPPGWLSDLPLLENVTIFGNGLIGLPPFRRTPLVRHIDLSVNKLETIAADIFTELTQLVSLDLSRNMLTMLPDSIFGGLVNLDTLSLARNGLRNLPNTLLHDQHNLRILKLSHNNLTSLNTQALHNLNILQELHLDHNQLRAIDINAFAGQADTLREVFLNHNNIALSENNRDVMYQDGIAVWGIHTPFQHLNQVTRLDLSHNVIGKVFDDFKNFMPQLNELDLSHNSITQLTYDQLNFMSKNVDLLDLSSNQIRDVQLFAAPVYDIYSFIKKLPRNIILDDNPLHCDCGAHAFVSFLQNKSLISPFAIGRCTCASPPELRHTPLSKVPLMALVCENHGDVCPSECSCHIRPEDRVVIVDCSSRNLTNMPQLRSPAIIDYHYVDLRLQDNLLETVDPSSFRNGSSELAWQSVYRLNVSNNRLSELASSSLPPQLEMLDVSVNRLKVLKGKVSRNHKSLRRVGLAGNPWTCECNTEMLLLVQSNSSIISDLEAMQCADKQNITTNLQQELCSNHVNTIVWISAVIAILALVVAILSFAYHKYQHEVKVWLFTHNLLQWLTNEEELDKDKMYDAFVSYSHKDEQFIKEHLVPTLERAPMNFRICWHVRDFMPGEIISTQIMNAVDQSRRTIIVLSANYLESVWGQMEFKTAYFQSIQDKRNRVIAIIYDDIGNIDDLDDELRAYLKTNTYLRWDDPWFWDKLRYAMPHPRMVKGAQITNNMCMASKDTLNLIKPIQKEGGSPDNIDIPNPQSTPPIQQIVNGTDSNQGPLDKLHGSSATAPLFTISNIKLDPNSPQF